MMDNPIVGPKFNPFSTHSFTYLLQYFHIMRLIDYFNALDFVLFHDFHLFCEILDDYFFHHIPRSRDHL
jgi:hypothetical protein